MKARRRRTTISLVAGALVIGGLYALSTRCAPSPEDLRSSAEGMPAVLKVDVIDNGGEDDLPFTPLPQLVTVTMRSSASQRQIQDVVDEYKRALAHDWVESLTVVLEGPVTGHLTLDRTTPDPYPFVAAYAAAARVTGAEDVTVGADVAYDDGPEERFVPYATLSLRSGGWTAVHAVMTTLGRRLLEDGIGLTVLSDGFQLAYGDKPTAREQNQFRVAAAVAGRFGLVGGRVVGGRRMTLRVPAGTELGRVRAFADRTAPNGAAGEVAVVAGTDVDLSAAPAELQEGLRHVVDRVRYVNGFTSAEYRAGELVISARRLYAAFTVDDAVVGSLRSASGTDDRLEAEYLPLTVRYLLPGGTVLVKRPGATLGSYADSAELPREGWVRITMTATPGWARLRLLAPRRMSRADALYNAKVQADGRRGDPPFRIVVVWPAGEGRRPLTLTGT